MEISAVAKKLQLKPGHTVAVLDPPPGRIELFAGVSLANATAGAGLDGVVLFARDQAAVDRLVADAFAALKPGGLLWVCYPKGGAKAGTDLNRDILRGRIEREGLKAVSLVAVDDEWSAMRFR